MIVHPNVHKVVEPADVGSTECVPKELRRSRTGAVLCVGTEIHMVRRMVDEHPDTVFSLDPLISVALQDDRNDADTGCMVRPDRLRPSP